MNGFLDDIKIYPYARTAAQIKSDFASKGSGSVKGTSVQMGSNSKNNDAFSNGLVGYWKMDEGSGAGSTLADSSGNNKTGTAKLWGGGNTATDSAHVSGKFGNAFSFDGGDDYITPSSGYTPNNDSFTAAAWINLDSSSAGYGNIRAIFGNEQVSPFLGYLPSSKTFYSLRQYSSGSQTLTSLPTANNLADSRWHHVAMTVDQVNYKVSYFVDGEFLSSTSIGTEGYTHSNGRFARIGWSWTGASYVGWLGYLDEVRIYQRLLSPTEVSKLYTWAPGPVGYWNFEEGAGGNANDVSGNGYTGVSTGTTAVSGKYGKARSFNGSSDWVSVTDNDLIEPKNITISSWFKTTSSSEKYIVTKNDDNYYLRISAGKIGFWLNTVCTGWLETTNTYNNNQWHFVSATYSGTSKLIYVDGILQASNNSCVGGNIPQGAANLQIGTRSSSSSWAWAGQLDDVRIYNYARTSGQITEDMNAGHPLGGSPVGSQVGYWKFDEGYGDTANNSGSGGSALNGDLAGACPGAATCPTWSNNGKFEKALSFDNNYVQVNDNDALDLTGTGSMTFTAWFKPTGAGNGNARIIDKQYNSQYIIYRSSTNNHTYVMVASGAVDVGNTPLNQWYQATGVYNNGILKGYLNGVYIGSANVTVGNVSPNAYPLGIGIKSMNGSLTGEWFQGLIDEVKIYNAALTADEVKLDYNRGAAMVLGTLSDTSGLTGGSVASSSASAAYCVPGDTTSCAPPVAEWNFEEGAGTTLYDKSGNGKNSTSFGGSPIWSSGKIGKSLKFNGTSDNIVVPIINSNDIAVSGWFKRDMLDVSAADAIFGGWQWDPDSQVRKGYDLRFYNNQLFLQWIVETTNGSTITEKQVNSGNIALNVWNHATGTYDSATGIAKLYINGMLISSSSASPGNTIVPQTQYSDMRIGYSRVNNGYFDGSIDELKIFNYARTPAQIAWDYNQGKPIGWWKMDECQGITANDSSGNGNTGTITIGATGTNTSAGTCTGSAGEAWKDGAIGKYNSSLEFDGTDDWVNYGNPSSLRLDTTDFTISAWIKPTTATSTRTVFYEYGTSNGAAAGQSIFFTAGHNGNGNLTLDFYGGGCNSGLPISTNVWNFIAVTYNKTTKLITYYKDGQTSSCTGSFGPSFGAFNGAQTGARYAPASGPFTVDYSGITDDLHIYNYALTPQQVKMIYNGGAAVQFAPATGSP